MAVRKLPKDVLKMASGLISPSGLAGHRRPLWHCPALVTQTHPNPPGDTRRAAATEIAVRCATTAGDKLDNNAYVDNNVYNAYV